MILLMLGLAHANSIAAPDVAAPCSVWVSATVPANGATAAPVDVLPAVVLHGEFCADDRTTLTLRRADDQSVHAEQDVATGPLLRMDIEELEANTEYVLETTHDMSGTSSTSFTTGDTLARAPEQHTVEEANADADGSPGDWQLSGWVRVNPVADPDGVAIAVLLDPDDGVVTAAGVQTGANLNSFEWVDTVPDQVCFRSAVQDARGERDEVVETCVTPTVYDRSGCSSVPREARWLALGLALLGLIRRRA